MTTWEKKEKKNRRVSRARNVPHRPSPSPLSPEIAQSHRDCFQPASRSMAIDGPDVPRCGDAVTQGRGRPSPWPGACQTTCVGTKVHYIPTYLKPEVRKSGPGTQLTADDPLSRVPFLPFNHHGWLSRTGRACTASRPVSKTGSKSITNWESSRPRRRL